MISYNVEAPNVTSAKENPMIYLGANMKILGQQFLDSSLYFVVVQGNLYWICQTVYL